MTIEISRLSPDVWFTAELGKDNCLTKMTGPATTANRFLAESFLAAFTSRFMVRAEERGTTFVPWIGTGLADILCVQQERGVAKDNTVPYQGKRLQIPPDRYRCHYVKATVRVHAYLDETWAVFHGPRCLARYQTDGQLIDRTADPRRPRGATHRSGGRPIVDPMPTMKEKFQARG
jgi:hypothetical protein